MLRRKNKVFIEVWAYLCSNRVREAKLIELLYRLVSAHERDPRLNDPRRATPNTPGTTSSTPCAVVALLYTPIVQYLTQHVTLISAPGAQGVSAPGALGAFGAQGSVAALLDDAAPVLPPRGTPPELPIYGAQKGLGTLKVHPIDEQVLPRFPSFLPLILRFICLFLRGPFSLPHISVLLVPYSE